MGIEDELIGDRGDSVERAFEHVGISPDDVVVVGLSHLHYDHSGGVRWWAGRAPMHIQRRELEYSLALDAPEPEALFRLDYDDHRIDWRLADGDVEIAPGVTAVATYGHTIGHQSFVVDLVDDRGELAGGFVFAFDADVIAVGAMANAPGTILINPQANIYEASLDILSFASIGGSVVSFFGWRGDETSIPLRYLEYRYAGDQPATPFEVDDLAILYAPEPGAPIAAAAAAIALAALARRPRHSR